MLLKHSLSALFIAASLQAADLSKKRTREEISTISNRSWAIQYELEGDYEESFRRFVTAVRHDQKINKDLRMEFAAISLVRHFEHQLKYNNPNERHASMYHKDGAQHLLEIEQYYTSAFNRYGCLLSAVNLGNIARAEEKREYALACYRCLITEKPNLSSLEQFSLFAIGYPLILEYPMQIKASSAKKLLQLTLKKNDFYVQTFKELCPVAYNEAYKIIMNKNLN